MKFFLRLLLIAVSLTASFCVAQSTIPPGTGVGHGAIGGVDYDSNWSLIYSDIPGESPAEIPEAAARLIPLAKRGSGWFVPATGSWIGPDPDQSNASRGPGCCGGTSTYELDFTVSSVNQAFNIFFCADDYTDVRLNGNVIYNSTDSIYTNCQTLKVTSGFQAGNNFLHFNVSNVNGPTGLYVTFTAVPPTTSGLGSSSGPRQYSAPSSAEPVDSASGQYYETESDIELGGPMLLGFRRYYSSQLSTSKIPSALGTNWMSNFDAVALVGDSTAQVGLMGGIVLTFTKSGSAWQLTSPKDIVYQFQASGSNYQLLDPRTQWVYTFASTGKLTSITNRNGGTITVTQGANGPSQITDGLGRTLTLTYTGANLTKIADQANRSITYAYANGLLTSSTDYFGLTTKYAYSGTGFMTSKTLPLGNIPTTQVYDSQGRVTSQSSPGADGSTHTMTFTYDGAGGTTITDATGKVTKHVSANGEIAQWNDPVGGIAVIAYDASDRRASVTDTLGNKTSYTYQPETGNLASITDALGNATRLTYTAQASGGFTYYDLTRIDYADGSALTRTVDSRGNALTETARNGGVTKSTYDANGHVLTITRPGNGVAKCAWNADGTMASLTDEAGNITTFGYDNTKRMTSRVDLSGTTTFVLDQSTTGPMMAISSPVAKESATIYDDQNRHLQDVVNSQGSVYHSDYTPTGLISAYTDPLKRKSTFTYDADDRLSTATNRAGEKATYTYDAAGRATTIADANGTRFTYTYTAENQISSVTDGAGRKTSYSYDALGRVTAITTPAGHVYKTAYDKVGSVTSSTDPLGAATAYTNDAAGLVKSITAPGGVTTAIGRDAEEAIASITSPNGNTWTFARDADGRLTKLTDPLGQAVSLTYTGTDVTAATLPLGTVALTNDADGRVLKQQFSDGLTIANTFDSNGGLTATNGVAITRDVAGQATNINGIGITYDGEGRPLTLTYAAGKTITYAYDSSGLLTSVTDWVGGKTAFNYDGSGKLTSFTYPNGVSTTTTFDADGALAKVAVGSLASINITRDAAGKITAEDRNLPVAPALSAATQQFTYDAAGQTVGATYDAMGRVTVQNGRTYTWNLASQMTSFHDAVNSATFTYDGLGEINSSTATGTLQNFVFNYALPIPALSIVRQSAADLRYYVYLPNGLLLYSIEASNGARHFYHFDEMGNTAFLTDDKGAVSDSYALTPYGEIAAHNGTSDNPFVWQGQFGTMQVGANLYYMRDRYYDATGARFLSRDPEIGGDPLASEPYAYAGGNPMLYVDPFGSNFFSWVGDGISAAANAAKNAAIAAANAAKNAAAAAAAAAQRLVDNVKKAISPPKPVAKPATPVPPAKTPVASPVQLRTPAPALVVPKPGTITTGLSTVPAPTLGKPLVPVQNCSTTLHLDPITGGLVDSHGNRAVLFPDGSVRLITNDGGSAVSHDGGTVVSNDGGTVVSNDGGTVVSNDGGTFKIGGVPFVNHKGTLISQDGNNFVISVPLIGQDGNGILSQGGGNIVAQGGLNSTQGASIISDNSEGFRVKEQ